MKSFSIVALISLALCAPLLGQGLVINEFMADNRATVVDTTDNKFEDWIEIYNSTASDINLAGYFLTDKAAAPRMWPFPPVTLAAGGFALVWADNDSGAIGLHTNFGLSRNGEFLGLYMALGANTLAVDTLSFGPQAPDISFGRTIDGAPGFKLFGNATPGKSNQNSRAKPRLLLNEFMADNATTIADPSDNAFDDWIELYNGMTFDLDLSGFFLTDDPADPTKWPFPDSLIEARGFRLVWADKDTAGTGLHANFSLGKRGDFLGLYQDNGLDTVLVDARFFGPQLADISSGRNPDGGASFVFFSPATPAASNLGGAVVINNDLSINEIMADNASTIADPSDNAFDDWIELYNGGFEPANLAGYYLSDSPGEPTLWPLPDSILGSGEFLLIWADKDANAAGLHANFKLSKSGEFLGLFLDAGPDTVEIDTFTFQAQSPDTSYGLFPDGGIDRVFYSTSTPGASNSGGIVVSVESVAGAVPETFTLEQNFPNPFNPETEIRYALPTRAAVKLTIFNLLGQRVATLINEKQGKGNYRLTWNGQNEKGQSLASGIYVYRLRAGDFVATRRMLLLR